LPKARSNNARTIIEPVTAADAASKMRRAPDNSELNIMLLIRSSEI